MCEIHKLPLALKWIKHRDFDDLNIRESAWYENDSSTQEYLYIRESAWYENDLYIREHFVAWHA